MVVIDHIGQSRADRMVRHSGALMSGLAPRPLVSERFLGNLAEPYPIALQIVFV